MFQLTLNGILDSSIPENPTTSSVRPWRAVLQKEIEDLRRECDRLRSTLDGVDLRIESDYIYYDSRVDPHLKTKGS